MRELVDAKVASQLSRAMRYVEALDARYVVPDAGPPCFLDPELFGINMITGDELSIFPDQRVFLDRLRAEWKGNGILAIPGTDDRRLPRGDDDHPSDARRRGRADLHREAGLPRGVPGRLPALARGPQGDLDAPTDDLFERLRDWWEPLLAMAPMLRQALGANVLLRAGDLEVLIDFPNGQVRRYAGEDHRYRFEIQRELVETVAAQRAVDWSNALFLSCRFTAWRDGPFNEYVYNFFKSLSRGTNAAHRGRGHAASSPRRRITDEEIEIGDYVVERYCPHRNADLAVFGELDGCHPHLHAPRLAFDLDNGVALPLVERPPDPGPTRRPQSRPATDGVDELVPARPRSGTAGRTSGPQLAVPSPRWAASRCTTKPSVRSSSGHRQQRRAARRCDGWPRRGTAARPPRYGHGPRGTGSTGTRSSGNRCAARTPGVRGRAARRAGPPGAQHRRGRRSG